MLEASIPVVTNSECSNVWPNVNDGQICAGGVEGTDTCQVKKVDLITTEFDTFFATFILILTINRETAVVL